MRHIHQHPHTVHAPYKLLSKRAQPLPCAALRTRITDLIVTRMTQGNITDTCIEKFIKTVKLIPYSSAILKSKKDREKPVSLIGIRIRTACSQSGLVFMKVQHTTDTAQKFRSINV